MDKFKTDMKAAVLSGSLTIPQLKDLQSNVEILKAAKADQKPGAPVDLLTPYRAVTAIRTTMATVKPADRLTLQQDVQALLAAKKTQTSAVPPSAGQKLGKDVFTAVMFGKPTESQVQQLQDSLNSLQHVQADSGHPLQQVMGLKKAKGDIETVINAGSFRDQDRQAVLADLNNLGGGGQKGLGMRRRG
jgi:hypothetical protein